MQNITPRKLLIGFISIFLIFTILMVLTSRGGGNSIDAPPEDSSELEYTNQARIVDGEELFRALGGPVQYDSISKDLFVFARTNYKEYSEDTDKIVGFKLTSAITKNGSEVSFSGRFGSLENNIDVKINLLKYDRIKSSVTDTEEDLSIDSQLPSNSRRNQFIASLPIDNGSYSIEYVVGDESFVIKVQDIDGDENPREDLREYLGVENLDNENVKLISIGSFTDRGVVMPREQGDPVTEN